MSLEVNSKFKIPVISPNPHPHHTHTRLIPVIHLKDIFGLQMYTLVTLAQICFLDGGV